MAKNISFLDILFSLASWPMKLIKVFDYWAGGAVAHFLPALPKAGFPEKIDSILIIRPGGIGDAVFLLPIIKALKDQGIAVDVLCQQRNAEVFTSQAIRVVSAQALLFKAWQSFSYDVIIDTEQWHYSSALIAYFVRSSYKIGFATRPKRAKLFHKAVEYELDGYELYNFLRLFKDIFTIGHIKGVEGSFYIDIPTQAWAKEQIPDRFVTVFLGASIAVRRLKEEQLMAVIQHYLEKNYSIALLGGKDVEDFAQSFCLSCHSRESGNPKSKIINYAGKLSLIQSGALIQRSSLFIGPDSGLMHLACAINVPVIGIFGPGNLLKWGPKGEKHKVITINADCSPCTRFGYTVPTCHGSYHCMNQIKIIENI